MTLNQDGHAFSGVISVNETSDIPNKIKLLEQEIEQIKLAVAGLTSGQESLSGRIADAGSAIAQESSVRASALAIIDAYLKRNPQLQP